MNFDQQLQHDWRDFVAALESGAPVRPGPVSPVALYAEIEDVLAAFAELRSSGLIERFAGRFITSTWTLRDLLSHMASWAAEFRRQVEAASRGESFDYTIPFAGSVFGPTEWNQSELEIRKQQSLQDIYTEFETESRRLQDFVIGLDAAELNMPRQLALSPGGDPNGRLPASAARATLMKCAHDRIHLARIQEWLAGL